MEPHAQVAFGLIQEQLQSGNLEAARGLLTEEHPADMADILLALEEADRMAMLGGLALEETAAVFPHLDRRDAAELAQHMLPETAPAALAKVYPTLASPL